MASNAGWSRPFDEPIAAAPMPTRHTQACRRLHHQVAEGRTEPRQLADSHFEESSNARRRGRTENRESRAASPYASAAHHSRLPLIRAGIFTAPGPAQDCGGQFDQVCQIAVVGVMLARRSAGWRRSTSREVHRRRAAPPSRRGGGLCEARSACGDGRCWNRQREGRAVRSAIDPCRMRERFEHAQSSVDLHQPPARRGPQSRERGLEGS